jgi:hypothetical protein
MLQDIFMALIIIGCMLVPWKVPPPARWPGMAIRYMTSRHATTNGPEHVVVLARRAHRAR